MAEVCNAVTPAPTTKTAVRNSGKLTSLAAGTKSRHPTTWMNNDTTIVRLYPIDSISLEVGAEKTKYARKKADSASMANANGSGAVGEEKIERRCGTSAIFRLVINPKMKNSAVTMMKGPM